MDRTAFVLSGLLVGLGVWLLACGRMVQALLPYLGLMAFHLAGPGSYDPAEYKIDLDAYYGLCQACIVIGVVLCLVFYAKSVRLKPAA